MVGGRCDGICLLRRHFVLGGSSDARIEQVKTCHRAPRHSGRPRHGPLWRQARANQSGHCKPTRQTHGASQEVALAFGHLEDRTPTHSYAATREAAMAAFVNVMAVREPPAAS